MTRKQIFSLTLLCCCIIAGHYSVEGSKFGEDYSDDVIQRVFHRSKRDIPQHEFVSVKTSHGHRSKRDVRPVEIVGNEGKKFLLNLTPVDDNAFARYTPVWFAKSDSSTRANHSYEKLSVKDIDDEGTFYKDGEYSAVLFAYYKNGYIFYDGVVGESSSSKVVKSVPEKWWRRPGSNDDHVVYEVDGEEKFTEVLESPEFEVIPGELDEPLEVLHPKLLVVVEYNLFKALGEDVDETVKYVATFWNTVNLKYEEFTTPKVKIHVTGIIIEKDVKALRYIYDSMNKSDMTKLEDSPIDRQREYFLNSFPLKDKFVNYDATITMLNLEAGAIAGQAYPGQICGTSYNVGFVKDDGSFSGLRPGVHELGHLLNMHHDGMGNSANCTGRTENGRAQSVMSAFDMGVDKSFWSECSKDVLRKFAGLKRAECLRKFYRRERP